MLTLKKNNKLVRVVLSFKKKSFPSSFILKAFLCTVAFHVLFFLIFRVVPLKEFPYLASAPIELYVELNKNFSENNSVCCEKQQMPELIPMAPDRWNSSSSFHFVSSIVSIKNEWEASFFPEIEWTPPLKQKRLCLVLQGAISQCILVSNVENWWARNCERLNFPEVLRYRVLVDGRTGKVFSYVKEQGDEEKGEEEIENSFFKELVFQCVEGLILSGWIELYTL